MEPARTRQFRTTAAPRRAAAPSPASQGHALLRAIPGAVLLWRDTGQLVDLSPQAAQLLGRDRPELVAGGVRAVWPEALAAAASLDGAATDRREAALVAAGGASIPAWVSTNRLDGGLYVSVALDLREQRQLEVELLQARKLEAIGQLASGIAHELNTPIQFVGDNLFFLQDAFSDLLDCVEAYRAGLAAAIEGRLTPAHIEAAREAEDVADLDYLTEEIPEALTRAREGAERVSTIVRAMRAFARSRPQRGPCDVNAELTAVLVIAKNEYKYVADVDARYGEVPTLLGDAGRLVQVFLNLIVNAAHAIEAGPRERGVISVATRAEGEHVVVSVGDDGVGIPEANRARIFEPFFTTKQVGKGLGQGLALVHAIVEEHGGRIEIDSEVGVGTTFSVWLPVGGGAERERF